jgi:hypothetical protein
MAREARKIQLLRARAYLPGTPGIKHCAAKSCEKPHEKGPARAGPFSSADWLIG